MLPMGSFVPLCLRPSVAVCCWQCSSFLHSQSTRSQQCNLHCCHPTNPRYWKQVWHLAAFCQLDSPSLGCAKDRWDEPDTLSPYSIVVWATQMCTPAAGTSRAPKTSLTVHGFAAPAAVKTKHSLRHSHFSWPFSYTADCFLTVQKPWRGPELRYERDTAVFLTLARVIQHRNEPALRHPSWTRCVREALFTQMEKR